MHIARPTLIALAVAAAAQSSAHAEGRGLQLYGTIDVGLTSFSGVKSTVNPGKTARVTGLSSGVNTPSAIGVKGSEDLGGGLSVFFQVETGFCAAGTNQRGAGSNSYCSSDGFMQRKAFAGLAGGFGSVAVGKQYTLVENAELGFDVFGNGYTGQIDNLSVVGSNSDSGRGLVRLNQAVTWTPPRYAGFGGALQYSFNSGTRDDAELGASTKPTAWQADLNYAAGPVLAGANYAYYANAVAPAVGTGLAPYRLWTVYGSYDFGALRAAGTYQTGRPAGGRGTESAWMLGVVLPSGPGRIMGSYIQRTDSVAPAGQPVPANSTARQIALGYAYDLSKRTQLYTSYASIGNASSSGGALGTAYTVGSSGDSFDGIIGQRSEGFALGMTHRF